MGGHLSASEELRATALMCSSGEGNLLWEMCGSTAASRKLNTSRSLSVRAAAATVIDSPLPPSVSHRVFSFCLSFCFVLFLQFYFSEIDPNCVFPQIILSNFGIFRDVHFLRQL